jgi:NAD(P)-dependent dehydrogenase (short-subunit alcohol dehydrogenase family)
MTIGDVDGGTRAMRTVVVGASTGLGRCIGIGLAQRGAEVALLARRHDLLVDAAKEAGAGTLAIACDVTDGASCRNAVAEAVGGLGGIDGVVYAPAVGVLRRIEELEPDDWRRTFETNVIGATTFTAAALPHLVESSGTVAFLSSVSASVTPPWPGLAAYTVSKAAMDKLVEAWRAEHPNVGFTRVVVGDCGGGEGIAQSQFTSNWDLELAAQVYPKWIEKGLLAGSLMDVDELIAIVEAVLRCGATATIPSIVAMPRQAGPTIGTGQ